MVDSCGMRHQQLCVLLGDGWREPGLRGHGSRGDRGYSMKRLYRFVTIVGAAGSTFYAPTSDAQSRVRVVAENTIAVARASETVAVPWSEVARLLTGAAVD